MEEKKSFHKKLVDLNKKVKDKLITDEKKEEPKIKFYKKVWYSIGRIDKYYEMAREGLKSSHNYFILLILILSVILSIFETIDNNKFLKDEISKLENNIPEFTYSQEILQTQNQNLYSFDNKIFSSLIGNKIIIDTYTEHEEVVNEYIKEFTEGNNGIILLKNKVIYIDDTNETKEYSYKELMEKYAELRSIEEAPTEVNKMDLMNFINEIPRGPAYYFMQYLVYYFASYFMTFIVCVWLVWLVIGIITFIICKIKKVKIKLSEMYSMTIYASTLITILFLIYMIIYYFTKTTFIFNMDGFLIITAVYLIISLIITFSNKKKEENNA